MSTKKLDKNKTTHWFQIPSNLHLGRRKQDIKLILKYK